MTKTEALWDSFCHWTDNWARRAVTTEEVKVSGGDCACCRKWIIFVGCANCPLTKYGMRCLANPSHLQKDSPYEKAYRCLEFRVPKGTGIRFGKAAVNMALVLYLLYLVEGGP